MTMRALVFARLGLPIRPQSRASWAPENTSPAEVDQGPPPRVLSRSGSCRATVLSVALLGAPQVLWSQAPASPFADSGSQPVVLRGGFLFDGIRDVRVPNSGIVVRDGKLMQVGGTLSSVDLAGARVVDLADTATILPGMFDLHAHYNMDLAREGRVDEFTYNPIIWLANGVTSTFPAGEFDPEGMMQARLRIDSGKQIGPRIYNSGPYFGAFRCEYQVKHPSDNCPAWPNNITDQQIRDEVDKWAARGMQSIKIKQATPHQVGVIIAQAHKHRITVTGHLNNYNSYESDWDVEQEQAILMGIDRIEHTLVPSGHIFKGEWMVGTPEFKHMIDLMLQHRVYFDATMRVFGSATLAATTDLRMRWTDESRFFTPYMQAQFKQRVEAAAGSPLDRRGSRGRFGYYGEIFDHKVPELKAFYDAGGGDLITVGTDNPTSGPNLAGFGYHRELQAMVHAGLPPVAVLKAATINGARAMKVGQLLGSIEPGKLADLVVVDGNPLERIEDARNVRWVMKSGELYDAAVLFTSVEGKIGPAGSADLPKWKGNAATRP
jgi:imidazolonepropionase-like amidohydrolase